jgi:hypothetical protein
MNDTRPEISNPHPASNTSSRKSRHMDTITIGPLGEHGHFSYAFLVTAQGLSHAQYDFMTMFLDDEAHDVYLIADRSCLVVFEERDWSTPEEFRDYLEMECIDKWLRRCCDPSSPRFITDERYADIREERFA